MKMRFLTLLCISLFQLYVNRHVSMVIVSNQTYVCALMDGLTQLVKQVLLH
jgi:hypothetical protein